MASSNRHAPDSSAHRTVIVGGGVAGIAAAVRLAEAGVAVTLVESRDRLGGRATSFDDPTTGDQLDNCQHVVMRCCTNVLDLYERLGVADQIEWHDKLYFVNGSGKVDTMSGDDLPAPLHLMRSMMGFDLFDTKEKLAIARGMLAVLQVSPKMRERLERETFADWLAAQNQPESVINRFWATVIVSACNEQLDTVSAKYAIKVFQDGFLSHPEAYIMGLASVPLVELYDAAGPVLEEAGGRLLLTQRAESFAYRDGKVQYLKLTNGEEVFGSTFISALPFDRLPNLCTADMVRDDARLRPLDRFHTSPIIGIHLFLRSPSGEAVMDLPHLILTDSPIQWVFNKGVEDGKQHLHAVVSAADALVELSTDELVDLALAELRKALPKARSATLEHGRAVKEKKATFSIRPGVDGLRPDTAGAIENLLLAGDWVATGWPATMEGAARSGYRAAAAALELAGIKSDDAVVPDLEAGALYRFMSG